MGNSGGKLKKGRIDSLQALRALAFLGIFISHCYDKLGGLGGWGVSIFFVLSGFVMVYSYYDKSLEVSFSDCIKFSVKKLKRLYPLHLLMMLAASYFLVKYILQNISMRVIALSAFKAITDIFLIQSWFPREDIYFSINSVAWYLSVCLFLYAVFPLILKRIQRLNNCRQAVVWMAIIFIIQVVIGLLVNKIPVPAKLSDNFAKWATYIFPVYRCGDFIAGCNLGYIFINNRHKINRWLATFAELAVFILIVLTLILKHSAAGIFANEGINHTEVFTLTTVAIIYLFACENGLLTQLITNKASIYIGNLSAYAFLIHIVVIRYIKLFSNHFFGHSPNAWMLTISAFVLTAAVSEAYKLIEKRIKLKKRSAEHN